MCVLIFVYPRPTPRTGHTMSAGSGRPSRSADLSIPPKLPYWSGGIEFDPIPDGFQQESPMSALYDNSFQPFAQIYIMNVDGSNRRALTHSRWEDSMPGLVPQTARH